MAIARADLIGLRRTIHRHPELAGREERTAALVAERLRAAGLDVITGVGGHGVIGVLGGALPGRTIAYRADLDAVPMQEEYESDFRSTIDGVGHLCGHDLHTTIGVGVAEALARDRRELRGQAVFLFQPAEETLTGARAMIDDGALRDTTPSEIYALHCAHFEVGTFAVMPGVGVAGDDAFDLTLRGPAAKHAIEIQARVRALSTVAFPTTLVEQRRALRDTLVEDGPFATFVLAGARISADDAVTRIRGWVKAWPDDLYPDVRKRVAGAVREVGGEEALGGLTFRDQLFPAMVSSPELSSAAAAQLATTYEVVTMRATWPFNGEDFALFLQRVPGAMFFLGIANDAAGLSGIVHTPTYAADERAIGIGVAAMTRWLSSRMSLERSP